MTPPSEAVREEFVEITPGLVALADMVVGCYEGAIAASSAA
jgi:hypothetical protein